MPRVFGRKETVEAEQLTADNAEELAAWCNGTVVVEVDHMDNNRTSKAINYPTLYGNKRVSEGQYLVKGSDGFRTMGASFPRDFNPIDPEDMDEDGDYEADGVGTEQLDEANNTLNRVFGPRKI